MDEPASLPEPPPHEPSPRPPPAPALSPEHAAPPDDAARQELAVHRDPAAAHREPAAHRDPAAHRELAAYTGGGPRIPHQIHDELEVGRLQFRRRTILPACLFLATCVTTFCAGVYGWEPAFLDLSVFSRLGQWRQGLTYMVAVMGVLLAHEMGHFLMTVRFRIRASYPMFIPVPVMMTGTMGAVIGMDGRRADRRQLFDIGLAGPLAGLVVTLPLIYFGLKQAVPTPLEPPAIAAGDEAAIDPPIHYGRPLLVDLLLPHIRPDLAPDANFAPNAFYMAGWVGLLVTGLNMLPMSQLDGGHVIHALLGRKGRWFSRGFLFAAIAAVIAAEAYNWLVMLGIVVLIGIDHPPSSNDRMQIGPLRWCLGISSLAIPVLCFIPTPIS